METAAFHYSRTRSHKADQTIKTKLTGYESDSSLGEDYNEQTYVTGHEDKSPHAPISTLHSHPVGSHISDYAR